MPPASRVTSETDLQDPAEAPARKRRRFWARLVAIAAGGLFVLPTVLQTEPQPQRADAVQAAGPADGAGGGKGRSSQGRPRHQTVAQARQPFYGAVRDTPLSELETLSSLRARATSTPRQASLDLENPQVDSFATPAAAVSSLGPFSIPNGQVLPITAIGGVAPPVTTNPGNPTTPPTVVPPVVTPPVVTPPVITPPIVTPPVVTPPITGPSTPPLITPPDNPPVTPPLVVTPDPPPTDPGFPSGPIGGGPGVPGLPGPIPEPATWIQLILGAGMIGSVLRRRRPQPLTALRARSSAFAVVSRLS